MAETAPRRVFVETYGCTTNLGDSRTMEGLLRQEGHELVASADEADVVVVNTCTVVDTTQQRIEHRFADLHAAGKEVVAAGCMAAAQPDEVEAALPGAPVVGPRHLHHIGDVVAGRSHERTWRPKTHLPRTLGATDAVIQVSEGCLFSCSYCLTKKARGDQTSYPVDELVADVREAVAAGAVDIKLTSQDTSGFGADSGTHLPALMERLAEIGGDFKVRVGMMHPRTALKHLDALLDAYDHPRFYRFLHLPIQTGSPRILKAMRRGHTMDAFWQVVDAFRARFPDGIVSTDIIVAFPGETEADHQDTLALMRRLEAEHVNITRFAARPHTDAKTAPDRVPSQVAKRRSREATDVAWASFAAYYAGRVGERLEVTVLEEGKKPGSVMARGPAYEPVAIRRPADEVPLGTRLEVEVVDAGPTYLVAEPRSPPRPVGKPVVAPRDPARLVLPVLP